MAEPKVPDGPTKIETQKPNAKELEFEGQENPPGALRSPKATGGRRPYEELLEENRVLSARVEELAAALHPFAFVPDDAAEADGYVLYVLNRQGRQCALRCQDVRRARRALGMP